MMINIFNWFKRLFGITPKHRTLKASYTICDIDTNRDAFGVDIVEELARTMADAIAREIDHNILCKIGVLNRINYRYHRTSTYNTNHKHKRSRFNYINGSRGPTFRPRVARYIAY